MLGPAVLAQLERADREQLVQTFASIHETLRRDASARAADAILELMAAQNRCAVNCSRRGAMSSAQLAFNLVRDGLRAGVDEAGRGPLAGPVVAAAVILDPRRRIRGIRDSKSVDARRARRARAQDPRRRDRLVGRLGRRRGDRHAQHPAGDLLAMRRALLGLARAAGARADRRRSLSVVRRPAAGLQLRGHRRRRRATRLHRRGVDPRQDDARRDDGRPRRDLSAVRLRRAQGLRTPRALRGARRSYGPCADSSPQLRAGAALRRLGAR